MEELINQLKLVQANVVVMYTKTHGYHWNVEGILFKPMHAFLLEIYEDVYGSLDVFSEHLRKLGVYAPYRMDDWMSNSNMAYETISTSPIQIMQSLEATNMVMLESLNGLFALANSSNEQGLANFVAERIDQHKFWEWQIKATLTTTLS
jgi:starvation-inducible DNA-binding protein